VRLTLTGTTPPASERERRLFRRIVAPQGRRKIEDGPILTVGDVIDLEPGDCRVHFRTYKAATGHLGLYSKLCGRRTCPTCVMGWLCDRVAPAWAYWGEQARILENTRDLVLRGPQAEPGIVVATFDGGRWAITPGDEIGGLDLDAALVRMLRDLPLELPLAGEKGSPVDWYGTQPDGTTPDKIRHAAEVAGIEIRRRGSRSDTWNAEEVTPEQNRDFVEALWTLRSEVCGPRVVAPQLPVHMPDVHTPQLPVHIDEIMPLPAGSPKQLPVHIPDSTPPQNNSSLRGGGTGVVDRPTCHMCDSDKWFGWEHDRASWDAWPWARERLLKAHYPLTCGYVRQDGDYWYDGAYLDKVEQEEAMVA
jgi:hypothetical protein